MSKRNMSDSNYGDCKKMRNFFSIPEKSHSDKKTYRIIKLENGLKAILVNETKTVAENSEEIGLNAACALTVDVGNFDDPNDVPGMAHFVEHELFMGSRKYPKENEYDMVINKNGGENNAETEAEETCFYFQVPQNALDKALDVFSNLLTEPLFDVSSMDREMNAIDSEFDQVKQDDSVRCDEIISKFANQQAPHSKFTWGTKETLSHMSLEELRKKVEEFWSKTYSANRMFLCLQGSLSLDELERKVEKHFTKIPNHNLIRELSPFNYENAFQKEFFEKIIYVNSTENKKELNLIWVIPSQVREFKCKAAHFLEHLLDQRGPGGLTNCLKTRNFAQHVTAGVNDSGFDTNRIYSLFYISIKLSKLGYENLNLVIDLVYSYLKLIKRERGQLLNIYNELKSIHETEFKFQNENELLDNVQNLTLFLKYFPEEHVLNGNELYFEYDEKLVFDLIDHLNDKPCGYLICSQIDMDYNEEEYYTKAKYKTGPIPEQWLNSRTKPELDVPEFHLPYPNTFITTNFDLENFTNITSYPRLVFKSDVCQLFYKEDGKFRLPKVYMGLHLIVPLGLKDVRSAVLLEIFMKMLNIELQQCLAGAVVAGYSCEGKISDLGIELKLGGYSEKLSQLLDVILDKILTFSQFAKEPGFALVKEEMLCYYVNQLLTVDALNDEVRLNIIEEIYWSAFDKYHSLDEITFDDVLIFSQNVFKELKLKGLVQGNITEEKSILLIQNIMTKLNSKPVPNDIQIRNRSIEIPNLKSIIRVKGLNKNDGNSAIRQYYQIGPDSLKQNCILQLLMMMMEEPLFDKLRTKQQLGYDVSNQFKLNHGLLGFVVTIISQEKKHNADFVEEEIDKFLNETFREFLTELDDDDFEESRDSLIELKNVDDKDLLEEMNRNWSEILHDTFFFERILKEIEVLKTITKDDIIQFYENILVRDRLKKLSIQVRGSDSSENESVPTNENCKVDFKLVIEPVDSKIAITDISEFKKSCSVFNSGQNHCVNGGDCKK